MSSHSSRRSEFRPSIRIPLLLLACLLAAYPDGANAQPLLMAKRVSYLDTVVELYWRVECGFEPAAVSRDHLRIVENDTTEITEYDLFCPEPGIRYPANVALVLDHSGSMTGAGIAGLKDAAHAFVDSMQAGEETAIVWFSTITTIGTELTSDRAHLHAVIDAVPPMGSTACWDGIYAGLLELSKSAPGPSRSLIVLTDGGDASSTRTPAEIIALAQRFHVRVATISLGASTNSIELESIAKLTGGRYYSTPNAGQLSSIFLDAQALAGRMFDECSATYVPPIPCPVNLRRGAHVTLSDLCGGSLDFTFTYMTRHDSTQLTPVRFALGNAVVGADRIARIPLLTTSPFPLDSLPPFTCDITFDPDKLRFVGLTEDAAAAVAPGVAVSMDVSNHRLSLTSHVQRSLHGDTIAVLAADVFGVLPNGSSNYSITYAAFHDGCLHAIRSGGKASLEMELRPELWTDDTVRFSGRMGGSTECAVVIRNTGGAPLSVNSIQFQGVPDTVLRCISSLPRVIPPRGAGVLSLLFTPGQHGRHTGRIIIGTNSTSKGNYHSVPFVTNAVDATATAGPVMHASVDFGSIGADIVSDTTIRIYNPNDTPLRLVSVVITGANARLFEITHVPSPVLPPLGTDSVSLRVRYPASACLAARLEIGHDAPGLPPAGCELRANVGWPGRAILRPTYKSIFMHSVPVGTSEQDGITILNSGGLPLHLTNWRFLPQDTSVLRFVPPLPSLLEPGETAKVRVEFTPAARMNYRSDILFSTNDPEQPEARYYFSGYGSGPVDADPPVTVPAAFRIADMYPNPTRDAFTLRVDLAQAARVHVAVRDLLGRTLHLHDFGVHDPGFRDLRIAPPALRPGTYIITADTGGEAHSRLFTVIR